MKEEVKYSKRLANLVSLDELALAGNHAVGHHLVDPEVGQALCHVLRVVVPRQAVLLLLALLTRVRDGLHDGPLQP